MHDPDVLFLDEPTSGLDPTAIRDVVELISGLASEHGRTVILCTHFLGEAGRLAHRMAVLHRGRLHAFGTPAVLAAELWQGFDADLDLGHEAADEVIARIAGIPGVLQAMATPEGARVHVLDRDILPVVVRVLVDHGIDVFAAVPRPPTLEDVYFAIEARIQAGTHAGAPA
jgi:ABC-2 type transport system ATP-binding protein